MSLVHSPEPVPLPEPKLRSKFWKSPLLWIAWLAPLLLFPITPSRYTIAEASVAVRRTDASLTRYREEDYNHFSSAYGVVTTPFFDGDVADFFIPTSGYAGYEINPHWRYWMTWVGGAALLTAYLGDYMFDSPSISCLLAHAGVDRRDARFGNRRVLVQGWNHQLSCGQAQN